MRALAPQMPRRQVGRQMLLHCARGLSESTELGSGGRGRRTGARRRPRRRVGWLEVPQSHLVAIWALVAAAVVVRESGSVLGSEWLAVCYSFWCPRSQVRRPFHVLPLCCVREWARRRVEAPNLAEVRSQLPSYQNFAPTVLPPVTSNRPWLCLDSCI